MAERGRNKKRGPLSKEVRARQAKRRKEEIQKLKNIGVSALETFTPLGDVQTAKDASKAFQEGRYLDAAGNTALIAAGYTPLGPLVRPASRLVKNRQRLKGVLHPMMRSDPAYRQEELTDYLNIARGKQGPLTGRSVGAATAKTKTEKDLIDGLSPMEIEFQKQNPGNELLFQGTSKARQEDLLAGYREKNSFMAPDINVAKEYGTELTAIPVPKGTAEKMIHQYPIRGSRKPRAENREQIIIGPDPRKREQLIKEQGEYFENEEAIDFLEEMLKQTGIKPFKVKK